MIFFVTHKVKSVSIGAYQTFMIDIELVCDGSPIASVLVEWKAHYSGKWEQQQFITSLDQLCIQPKCTVTVEINWIFYLLSVSNLEVFPIYEVNQMGRAATGDPTLLDYGRFGECLYVFFSCLLKLHPN